MLSWLNGAADTAVSALIRAYFTKLSLLAHVIFYPVLMAREGGDFHLFLDGISIEAVFVGLMVGISTKTVLEHHHRLRDAVHELADRVLGHE